MSYLRGMWGFLTHLLDPTGFPPRWHCGHWSSAHGWLHIVSDLGVWTAYVAIPCVLLYFVLKRKSLPFRSVFLLFGAFILFCGTTHLMEAIIFWWPVYRLAGLIKLATALVSWGTVLALIPATPRALAMKTPDELEKIVERRTAELHEEIAQRQRAENALREQREILEVTLASIGDAVIATDRQGRITFINPVAEMLTGWQAAEARGARLETVFRIVNERTRQPVENPCQRVLRDGVVVGLANHTLLISKQGRELPIDDSAAPIRDREGQIHGVVLVFRDASAGRAYIDAKERLAAIVENSQDAVIGLDKQGVVTSWNASAEKLFGYTADEAIGRSIDFIIPADRRDEFEESMQRLREGRPSMHLDTIRVRKDGARIDVSSRISPIKNAYGEVIGASKLSHDISERKQAERAIREQRELLEVTLASIGDAVIATDRDARVTYMNPVAEALTGWQSDEAQGLLLNTVFPIINEQTRQPAENPCHKVLRIGSVVGLANHTVLVDKQGRETPIDDSAAPIRDRDGNVLGVVLVFHDASRERAHVEAKERLAAIVENSQDAIIGTDLEGVVTTWNGGAEKLFGYTAEEAVGQSIEMIIPPERRHEFTGTIERLRKGESVAHLDTVRVRKDGQRIDVSSRISPIKNAYGEVIGAAKVSHDISERKKVERYLRFLADATTELATLIDYESALQRVARSAVPFVADSCVATMINPNGELETVAYAHRDADKERVLRQLFTDYPLDWNSKALAVGVLKSGKSELVAQVTQEQLDRIAIDDRHRRMLMDLNPQSAVLAPIVVRNKTIGVLSFAVTESSRRYSESDLDLVNELARRTAIAVENAELYRDLKEAQRQKDDFLAMLAHELRNPLAAIQYANQLSKVMKPEEYPASDVIERQVINLSHLIDDLLDVSRITRNKIQLRPELIDGARLVQRAAASVQQLMDNRKHRLTLEISSEPMPLHVDATRIEQVLVNLLTNAAKYTPEGGQVTVRAYPAEGQAVFKVKDTGLGIPPEMLHHVFDLFTQVNQSLDRSQGGLGIGLTVVRRLAELHGGSVSATSDGPGQGSEFTVRLPLASAAEHSGAEDQSRGARESHQRILVVDDSIDTANAVALLLRSAGHTVTMAHDGFAALEIARSFRPDVILLDLGLPGIDGYKIAETLRSESDFRDVRLIAVSGYGQPEDQRRTKEAGFDHHLVKPVDFQKLMAILANSEPGERA